MTPENAVMTDVEMITVVIDGFDVTVPKGTLVIRAAEKLGIQGKYLTIPAMFGMSETQVRGHACFLYWLSYYVFLLKEF